MNTIFTVGIFLSLFLATLLFVKKNKSLADNVLGVWMVTISIQLASYYLYFLGYWETYPHLVGVTTPFPLLFGPLLYLYVDFSLRKAPRFRPKDWLHFLPFAITYLAMTPFLFGYSAEQKLLADSLDFNSEFKSLFITGFVMFFITAVIYPVFAYRKITNYQKYISDNFAYKETISLRWLKNLIWGAAAIFLSVIIAFLLQEGLNVDFGFKAEIIPDILVVIFIAVLGFFGIRQQGIFNDTHTHTSNPDIDAVAPEKESYKKSGLKTSDAEILHQKLLDLMKNEKPYLEPKLSLSQLAEKLDITSNNLSQIINQCDEKNFYDFVNGYRVQEFISLASSPQNKNMNLLGIALDAGFNSKSSFNQVFKKITCKTPREYLLSD